MHHRAAAVVDTLAPVRQVLSMDELECAPMGRWQQRKRAVGLDERVKAEVVAQLAKGMRTSVGIAPNMLMAKLTSNMQKHDGLTLLEVHKLAKRLYALKPKAINGIGPCMVQRSTRCGIHAIEQLWHSSLHLLAQPVTTSVQLRGLIEAGQHTGDLFGFDEAAADAKGTSDTRKEPKVMGSLSSRTAQKIEPVRDRRKMLTAIDMLNGKHGKYADDFASAKAGLDHAPMRIASNRIPDLALVR